MKQPSAAKAKSAIALLLGVLIGFAAWFATAFDHIQCDQMIAARNYERGFSDGALRAQPIYDKRATTKSGYMPLFLQKDPQWSSFAYSDGTIGTYGSAGSPAQPWR